MTSFDTFIEKMASQPDVIAAVAKSNQEWEEAAAAELEITVDELLSQMANCHTRGCTVTDPCYTKYINTKDT
jgi:hypothetical protein